MKLLEPVLLALLFRLSSCLIEENSLEFSGPGLKLIDSFSFNAGGTYSFDLTTSSRSNAPKVLLATVDRGSNCDTIGKTCTYPLTKISSICTSISALALSDLITDAFPTIPPSLAFTSKNISANAYTLRFSSWEEYHNVTSYALATDLQSTLLPNILNTLPFAVSREINDTTEDNANVTYYNASKNYITEITSSFSGTIKEVGRTYFALISCSNTTIKYPHNI